jgi:hypothetical protein
MAKKAQESAQIERARKKIEKQLLASEKQFNAESLRRMRELIENQLKRQSPTRVSLKTRQIVLFDENQHPAQTESRFVKHLLDKIKEGTSKKRPLKKVIKL